MNQLYDIDINENFSMFVLIKSADVRTARNGKDFIAFTFQDPSGSMNGMYWSATTNEIETFQAGRVVFLKGRRDEYNGQPQVRIEQLRLAGLGEPDDPTLYMERAAIDHNEAEKELEDALYLIHDAKIQRIVRKIIQEVDRDFFTYPAAKSHHHATSGGLLQHTITMLRLGKAMLEIYPQLNPSLLLGGIILHDIGKTIELSGPLSTEYTLSGNLIGHIVLMTELIDKTVDELKIDPDDESVICLKHMILSHHGKLEYGSPVTPRLLEAEVLHQIDMMDSRVEMIWQALKQTKPGEFSSSIYPLDRRSFYLPQITK